MEVWAIVADREPWDRFVCIYSSLSSAERELARISSEFKENSYTLVQLYLN